MKQYPYPNLAANLYPRNARSAATSAHHAARQQHLSNILRCVQVDARFNEAAFCRCVYRRYGERLREPLIFFKRQNSNPSLGISGRNRNQQDARTHENVSIRAYRQRDAYLGRRLARPSHAVPLRPASAAETESTAQCLSRACLLVGRDGLVAGCLDWVLLTTAEVGWAPHVHDAQHRGMTEWFLPNCFSQLCFFFIATDIFAIQSDVLT